IEVQIEYPEDEENISDTFDETNLRKAVKRLRSLSESWKSEKLYQDGARLVLCGKTNAGKSSLFNSLLKEDRAIVSDIEGTTRDWLESWADFEGIPARLFDTAGLRNTEDKIEAAGVELTKDLSSEADVILYLADSTKEFGKEDIDFIKSRKGRPVILVWNKCDCEGSTPLPTNPLPGESDALWQKAVCVSAKKGSGIADLVSAVKEILVNLAGKDSGMQAGLGSERQKESVAEALERVEHSLTVAKEGYSMDAVVQDLEDSLDSLGEVTGEVTPDDVLGSIFSHFCVGK
ncbi:MAG: 50S ribosome-binding GTPase, partial [Treponema sp.]|nr:50S ribosome-binding GTPase [Treponema sp.]